MAVNVKSCYLFLLDNLNQTFIPAERPLDETVDGAYYFLEKNIGKCMKNPAGRPATFREDSEIRKSFLEYRNRSISFLEFAREVAIKRYEFKERYEIFTASDLFICEVEVGDVEHVIGLELTCKEEMIHHVKQIEGGIQNNLIVHQAVIPQANLKNANYFMIGLDKLNLTIIEKMISTVDDDTYLYADKILECETNISIKEAIKTARMVADEIIEQHELEKLVVVPALEQVIKETINVGDNVDLQKIADEVFYNDPVAKSAYISELDNHGIDKPVLNQNAVKIPIKKMQKLKTDTGIEISVPLDFYNNKDYIEVVSEPNGRLSIQIKNIGSVENKRHG